MSQLLFISGFPGGGTDLTKTILNAHPDIYINGEMPFLSHLLSLGYNSQTKICTSDQLKGLKIDLKKLDTWQNIENLGVDLSNLVSNKTPLTLKDVLYYYFSKQEKTIWGNKTPQSTEEISQLIQLFPDARFLIVTRDVRAVCLSWKNKWGKNINLCASKWAHRMSQGWLATQSLNPKQYHLVKFEEILTDTETTMLKICDFLNIPFSGRMLEHQSYTTEIIDGKINYGQAIKRNNREKWRVQLNQNTILRIEEISYNTMKLLGYKPKFALAHKPLSRLESKLGKINDAWSLIAVGNRARSKNDLSTRFKYINYEIKKKLRKKT